LTEVEIRSDFITLGQFLKFAGIVTDGADARVLLADEAIQVNGDTETRRGRKLYAGDTVTAFSNDYLVTRKSV
jgi:ribosome-associated protein